MKNILMGLFFTTMITAMFCSFPPQAQSEEVTFEWTAVGDDSTFGTASGYDMRRAVSPQLLIDDWDSQDVIVGLPIPLIAGTVQSVTVEQPNGTTFYYSIRAVDEALNWAEIGNIAERTTLDVIAPAAIMDLRIVP